MDAHAVEPHPGTERSAVARSGALLLTGTLLANVLSYAFFVILSRHLSEDSLGAVGAMVNLTAIAVVPALGLQLVAAREVARVQHGREPGASDDVGARLARDVLRLGLELGTAGTLAVAVLSPLLAGLLHVDVPTLLVLGASMIPLGVTFAVQGLLQGLERFTALAVVLAASGTGKLLAALTAVWLGGDVLVVVTCLTAGWALTLGVALLSLGPTVRRSPARRHPTALRRMVTAAALPTSGLLVLSSLDVLLARHHLSPVDSGAYTVGALFEKAAFWGMAFIATLFYPGMAREDESRRATTRALVVTSAIGAVGVAVTVVVPGPLVVAAGGDSYAALAPLLWRFTLLGVALALVQVLVYARLARGGTRAGIAVWVAAGAVVVVTLVAHSSVADIVTSMVAVTTVLTIALLAHALRSTRLRTRR